MNLVVKVKGRSHDPRCDGRFSELRGRFYEVARIIRHEKKDPLWAIINYHDLEQLAEKAWEKGEKPITIFDVTDPYTENKKDKLRGDPLVGGQHNLTIALVPFVFEAMRETLLEKVRKAQSLSLNTATPNFDPDELHIELSDLTYVPIDILEKVTNADVMELLAPIASRDFTVTSNSVYPGLFDEYAALYVTSLKTKDRLRLFHRGVTALDQELELPMDKMLVPRTDSPRTHATLSGYFMRAEFGTGPNTSRTQVASAPYRVEVYKTRKNGQTSQALRIKDKLPKFLGDPNGDPVFGMSFYLRHPDTMVLYQIQDIAGANVPHGTTNGLCGLMLMEKIARALELKEIDAYSHHTNPMRMLYPDDATLANVLKINFDEAAKILRWEKISRTDGRDEGYRKMIR